MSSNLGNETNEDAVRWVSRPMEVLKCYLSVGILSKSSYKINVPQTEFIVAASRRWMKFYYQNLEINEATISRMVPQSQ